MNTSTNLDYVMEERFLAEEAPSIVSEVLRYKDAENMRSALDIIADECYWRDPNNVRYDVDRCRFPRVSDEEEASNRASIPANCKIGEFLKVVI
ncbi:hypothetical protein ACERZ8_00895 [Tateyamaria armeniaca]|uniref:Uncharacterized protein n=1 Tax=Tateyamaria armeniaca TaxID=2518930 RepID=A0ABW8UN02_9RHOB